MYCISNCWCVHAHADLHTADQYSVGSTLTRGCCSRRVAQWAVLNNKARIHVASIDFPSGSNYNPSSHISYKISLELGVLNSLVLLNVVAGCCCCIIQANVIHELV